MTTGRMVQEQNLEKHIKKQMGCMAGFLQIFDRHQLLHAKRLPSSATVVSSPESESAMSLEISKELEKQPQNKTAPSPDRSKQSPSPMTDLRPPSPETRAPSSPELYPKSPLPLPVFEFKEGTRSSWKFSREAPRLSLDSRATVDAKGSLYPREIRTNAAILTASRSSNVDGGSDSDKQHRSPSVIARLMGLEPIQQSNPEPIKLRRSASESRVNRDLNQYRFVDGNNFQQKQPPQQNVQSHNFSGNAGKDDQSSNRGTNPRQPDPKNNAKAQSKGMAQRKCFYDSADFFPEPKQSVSVYNEIEKRLKMRGIDEPSKDLETLKQILEALQLKGLLHSRKASNQINSRNFVYDRSFESPIVVMKPSRSPSSTHRAARFGNESPPPSSGFRSRAGVRRNGELSPRRDLPENVRSQTRGRSPAAREGGVRSPSRRGRPLSIETQRKGNDSVEHRRVSPVQSPKISSRRPDQTAANRSPRNIKKPTVEIAPREEKVFPRAEDEYSTTMSDSSINNSTSSQADTERWKAEEYKEGRSLLERCDKLLHSIAELQPSPVSVLDSSFYKEESSPSPVMKRSIDFKVEMEDICGEAMWGAESEIEDGDLVYVSEILRVSNYLPEDSDIFLLLEKKQHFKGKDTSKESTLERRLIFDTVTEILDRNCLLPPWKAVSWQTSLPEIWSEFRRIRERDESEDLFEVICGVLRKDLAGDSINGWGDCSIEMSDAVLDIERLIFKDLIGETIRDLAAFPTNYSKVSAPCRKLVF
ncbi:protein LONGIFOLIA 1 [Pyrus ussuriensis x Pyrus communis]|uniref:Protein LONGIFOLIA 1 n=1 Tax=Pyrus ussuriensis x Pyrus communis TaxID=2448454 RepID=A0A5N5GKM1_9ROSA|nr:protein LONGIFOLIA 1 [Pyrus ussuriensis x Pyrus communis]